MSQSDTQRLTGGSMMLSSRDERRRQTLTFATVLVMLALAAGGALLLRDPGAAPFLTADNRAALARENAELKAELQRARTDFAMEQATRAELNRQAGELHAQINELKNRLEFLAARDSRAIEPR